jgi:serine protease inhibitor
LDELLTVLGAASRDEIAEFVSAVVGRALADCSESGAPLVAFACALWHEKTMALKPAYRTAAVESYKAETHAADFVNKVSFLDLPIYINVNTKQQRELDLKIASASACVRAIYANRSVNE